VGLRAQVNLKLASSGIDARRLLGAPRGLSSVRRDLRSFRRKSAGTTSESDFPLGSHSWVYWEKSADAGEAKGHYFHQDLLVAREVFAQHPRRHIDVGSSVHGFVSHVATFRQIEVLDIRPLGDPTPGIVFLQKDVTSLGHEWDEVADSVSCLHALEHFGLGRYGDPIDPDGWRRGLDSLTRMVQPGGRLYLSVPTGAHQRVEFNSHRVFALPYLRAVLENDFAFDRLSFVDDSGRLHDKQDPYSAMADKSWHANMGCSVWFLRKR
jgi:hypothetical protein